MNPATNAQRFRGGVLLYGLSVASGLANFAALKFLQHIAPQPSIYSQLSTILLSFTTFQLITDLGTQTQFIHNFRTADAENRLRFVHLLLQMRLVLGCAALLLSLVYVVSARFSAEMAISFLIYQTAFIPFAYMSTADSVFLAQEEFGKAILSRLARLVALICFLAAAIFTKSSSLMLPALCSTLSFALCACFVWRFILAKVSFTKSHMSFVNLKWWLENNSSKRAFIRGSSVAAIIIILNFLQAFVAQIYLIRQVGEKSLANFNTALVLATPAILAFQTLAQIQLPTISDWATAQKIKFKSDLLRFFMKMSITYFFMVAVLSLLQRLDWVTWFFPLSTHSTYEMSLLYITAHAFLCFASPLLALGQYLGRSRKLIQASAGAVMVSWLCQYSLNTHSAEISCLVSLLIFGVLLATIGLTISLNTAQKTLANERI